MFLVEVGCAGGVGRAGRFLCVGFSGLKVVGREHGLGN